MDQKAKHDAGKPVPTLVPREIIYAVERVRAYGVRKYPNGGTDNWKLVENQRYWDALIRHVLAAWYNYEAKDPESGLMHLEHIACNAAFLLEKIKEQQNENTGNNRTDDSGSWDDLHG